MKRIVTHKAPDADALVAAWLAATHLFPGEETVVAFVGRGQDVHALGHADCVVDVGNRFDPARLCFDHKPPAFADQNATCATRLVWDHLCGLGRDVNLLEPLVRVVFEGDTRRFSPALRQSRIDGVHAVVARLRREAASDTDVYRRVAAWLDEHAQTCSGPGAI